MNAVSEAVMSQVTKLVEKLKMKNYKISVESTADKGGNYLGMIYFICISGENCCNESQKLQIVAKCAETQQTTNNEIIGMKKPFEREVFAYKRVLTAFENLQKDLQVKIPFNSFPKCLTASKEDKVLIFDDLRRSNYSLWNRMVPMDEEHLTLVMKELGRLHALSFAFKENNPKEFREITSKLDSVLGVSKVQFGKIAEAGYRKCAKALKDLGYEDCLQQFERVVEFLGENFALGDCEEEFAVICHGDTWCNNLMFKYDSNKPTNLCFIDWQLARFSSPVVDISYFFYTTAGTNDLANLQNYLKIYHKSLSDFLLELHCDPNKLFPFEVFKKQWNEHAKYGLVTSLLLLHVMHLDETEVPDFVLEDFLEPFKYELKYHEQYQKRITDVAVHFVRNKYI